MEKRVSDTVTKNDLSDIRVDKIDMEQFDKEQSALKAAREKKAQLFRWQKKIEAWFDKACDEIDRDESLTSEVKIAKVAALMLTMSTDKSEKLKGLEQLGKYNGMIRRATSGEEGSDELGPLIVEHTQTVRTPDGRSVEITPVAVSQ